MSIFRKTMLIWVAVTIIVSTGLVFSTIKARDYNYRPYLHDNLYLPSGKFLKELSLGYRQIIADFVWLSAVQYYGDYRAGNHSLLYFKGLIDITTTLDPHFVFGYVFGALVVCEDIGEFDKGIDILRKGMQKNPQSWRLPFEIGFLNYIEKRDYEMAARYFDLASRLPQSSPLAKRFAAFVYSKAGHEETSIKMWEEIKRNSKEPFLRDLADRYLKKLKARKTIREDSFDIDG